MRPALMLVASILARLQQAPPSPVGRIEFTPAKPTMQVGDSLRLAARVFDAAGRPVTNATLQWFASGLEFQGTVDSTGLVRAGATGAIVMWASDHPAIASVTAAGRVTAHAPGRVTITARAGRAEHALAIRVAANNLVSFTIAPAQAAVRTGDVVPFSVMASARGGTPIAGALPEWSLTPGNAEIGPDGRFVADLAGTYQVTAAFAGKLAVATVTVASRDATRAVKVVGRLPIAMLASEFWLHPDGKHGYLGTISLGGPGGDRLYAIDLSDPAQPRITDSVVVDARIINDVMSTEDGKYAVLGREEASNRRNGIVILSLEDPAHPKPIAEYTETVTGGVHSTFVYREHVYLTDDATGSMRVIDIRDPYHPKEVGRWQTPWLEGAGRYLHDIDVKDGLAYLSYWNDGLVILDVGNGVKGGTPERPELVSQLKYDLVSLYHDVEVVGGPGHIRGTHTAWRHGKYVFVGDEVFPAKPLGLGIPGLGRAYGRLHVVDVSDLMNPKEVAYYEPKDGGSHNIWVAGDSLFLGDYQGGLRVVDVSGELKGDLLRQGREIAHLETGDAKGYVPNSASAWGAIYRDGYIYVPDTNSGLWIVRLEPKRELTP